MFERQHASNEALTWFLRGLGWLLTVIGFNMVTGILTTLGMCLSFTDICSGGSRAPLISGFATDIGFVHWNSLESETERLIGVESIT